jgi:hypothetical protein
MNAENATLDEILDEIRAIRAAREKNAKAIGIYGAYIGKIVQIAAECRFDSSFIDETISASESAAASIKKSRIFPKGVLRHEIMVSAARRAQNANIGLKHAPIGAPKPRLVTMPSREIPAPKKEPAI